MAIDSYDPSLEQDCVSCEDICNNDGCSKFFAVGPCSTIINTVNPATGAATLRGYVQPEDMIFDVNSFCRVSALNSLTYNPNQTIRKKGYIGECYETTKPGLKRPTIDVEIDFCRFDNSHCLLEQPGCLIAFVCLENRADFIENVSPTVMQGIRYGVARIEPGSQSAVFDEEDVRTYTLHIHRYMWEFNMCPGAPASLVSQSLTQDKAKVKAA